MHELDEVLLRREAPQHLLAERVPLHGVDEVAHDRDVHVRFEQRQAHVTERFLDVALRDPPLALQLAEERVELLAEGLEHQGERAFRKRILLLEGDQPVKKPRRQKNESRGAMAPGPVGNEFSCGHLHHAAHAARGHGRGG